MEWFSPIQFSECPSQHVLVFDLVTHVAVDELGLTAWTAACQLYSLTECTR